MGGGMPRESRNSKEYIRGWVGYYHLADMKRLLTRYRQMAAATDTHVYMESLEESRRQE